MVEQKASQQSQADSDSNAQKPYRACVVGVFVSTQDKVLLAKRSDLPAWQFPQGGVDPGETAKQALQREMHEEIGCQNFEILQQSSKDWPYDFPADMNTHISRKYRGQIQSWFLCRLDSKEQADLSKASSKEFCQLEWVDPQEALKRVVDWKKNVYQAALSDLGLLEK